MPGGGDRRRSAVRRGAARVVHGAASHPVPVPRPRSPSGAGVMRRRSTSWPARCGRRRRRARWRRRSARRSRSSCPIRGRMIGRCRPSTGSSPAACWPRPSRRHVWRRRRRPGERIRLGIVSGFFCQHTIFKLFLEGWLTQLDRGRFEVIGFHTGRTSDDQTARAARLVRPLRARHCPPHGVAGGGDRRGAARAAVSGSRHGPDCRAAGGAAAGAGAVRGVGPARDHRHADAGLLPVERSDGAAGWRCALHRDAWCACRISDCVTCRSAAGMPAGSRGAGVGAGRAGVLVRAGAV